MKRRRPVSEQAIEQVVEYTERILQPEIVVKSEVFARKQEKRTVEISPFFCVYLPENELIKIEGKEDRFLLKRAGKSLVIWLDPDNERIISIGGIDYCLSQEGKLIEVKTGVFVPQRKPGSKDYVFAQDEEGRSILDLRAIEGNKKIAGFFRK